MSFDHSLAALHRLKGAFLKAASHVPQLVMKVNVIAQMGIVALYHIAPTAHPTGRVLVGGLDMSRKLFSEKNSKINGSERSVTVKTLPSYKAGGARYG